MLSRYDSLALAFVPALLVACLFVHCLLWAAYTPLFFSLSAVCSTPAQKGQLKDVDVAVCTLERANSLVNMLLCPIGPKQSSGSRSALAAAEALQQIVCVVIDEVHMLGDANRYRYLCVAVVMC